MHKIDERKRHCSPTDTLKLEQNDQDRSGFEVTTDQIIGICTSAYMKNQDAKHKGYEQLRHRPEGTLCRDDDLARFIRLGQKSASTSQITVFS